MVERTVRELQRQLERLDGRGYKAYRELGGAWRFPEFSLHLDHIQGDPFAPPSQLRIVLPPEIARLPAHCRASGARAVAARDFLVRRFAEAAHRHSRRRGLGNGGLFGIDAPGQQVLERTACTFEEESVTVRFTAGLPARGRRIDGTGVATMLCGLVPRLAAAVCAPALDAAALRRHCDTVEDARALRAALRPAGLVAFVADGACLPRRSGVDERPLSGGVPLRAPDSLAVELHAPHAGRMRGLGIPAGITLIVGGGYHGKSTLLRALALGVYDHVPGDGRERVVTVGDAVKVRAEDGRAVSGVDISAFIGELPGGTGTRRFRTANASGSTSQAAAIVEAVEAGARVLLIDEDTSASNFMVRDRRMQLLVPREAEPITPFVDRTRELYSGLGVSTVLVMGGSGDYLDVADTVIAMRSFLPHDFTERARRVAAEHPTGRRHEVRGPLAAPAPRRVRPDSLDARRGKRDRYVAADGVDTLRFGRARVDLRAVEQLVHPSQVRAAGAALLWLRDEAFAENRTIAEALDLLEERLATQGLTLLAGQRGDLAVVRRHEIAAALNRLRGLRTEAAGPR